MISRTHDLAAIAALSVVIFMAPPESLTLATVLVAILANQIGGIAPDIDQPTAPFWRNLPIGGVVGRIMARMLGGHRFLTHSLLGLALFGWLTYTLLTTLQPLMPAVDIWLVWVAFMIGMVSHLVMDSFTKEGVPWLLPIPIKFGFPPIRRLRITTGKTIENFIILPGLLIFACWHFAVHYPQLHTMIHG